MSLISKIKRSAQNAKDKVIKAGNQLLDGSDKKHVNKLFKVKGHKYRSKRLLGEGMARFSFVADLAL